MCLVKFWVSVLALWFSVTPWFISGFLLGLMTEHHSLAPMVLPIFSFGQVDEEWM